MGISKKRDIEYRHQDLEARVPIMTWVGRRPAAKSLLNVPSDIPSISFAWDRKKEFFPD